MKGLPILALECMAAFALPVTLLAQPALPPNPGTLDAMVKEIRLLRQALERQSFIAARTQLLIGRLNLQDQRTARARQTVEHLESELVDAERERDKMETVVRETARALEQVTDDGQRQALESDSRMTEARLAKQQEQVSRAEGRLSRARQALDDEIGRYEELDMWLRDVEKQLQGGGR
jgi:hypothetical protein